MGRRLVIVGSGVERRRLERQAHKGVTFQGWLDQPSLVDLLRRARALLFPGEEDFGIVPLEAMACGAPVVAYGAGGVLETVTAGETGLFFEEPSAADLVRALERLDRLELSRDAARRRAEQFSRENFRLRISEEIGAALAALRGA
jgi:glycosyltransferase involved in cell wall biosynthesis